MVKALVGWVECPEYAMAPIFPTGEALPIFVAGPSQLHLGLQLAAVLSSKVLASLCAPWAEAVAESHDCSSL